MTYSRVLALVLLCCTSSLSYSDTTGDILDPSTISGTYEPCSGSDCWGGTSGGSNPSWNGGTARWGHGGGILAWNYALEQALAYAGIDIDGYNYSWRVKNKDANATQGCVVSAFNWFCSGDGADYMRVSVRFYDSSGSELWGKQYNLDGTYDWKYFTGQELFTDALSGADVETVIIRAEGDDPGNWAGHYGPEFDVSASSVTLIYSNNPCWPDPLYSPTCDGYAEAYAAKQLEELMEELNAPVEEPTIEVSPTTTQSTTTAEPIEMGGTQVTGESTVDSGGSRVQEEKDSSDDKKQKLDLVRSLEPDISFLASVTAAPGAEQALPGLEGFEANQTMDPVSSLSDPSQSTGNALQQTDTAQAAAKQSQSNNEERKERREKLKQIADDRAQEIADQAAQSSEMDDQTKQQLEQLAMMNFVPGFNSYQTALPGGIYPDVPFYQPTNVPESRRGLRNGLAQQLLHEQMIEMQYKGN